jgi:hypothetical protein
VIIIRLNKLLRRRFIDMEAVDQAIRKEIRDILLEFGRENAIKIAFELAIHEEIVLAARAVRAGAVDFLKEKALMPEPCIPDGSLSG